MTPLILILVSALIVATSFLSGLFGMAGGLVLIGVLLVVLPVPTAMILHGVTQIASNGWRAALWYRHIVWRVVLAYVGGGLTALAAWSLVRYVPDTATAIIFLGLTPFLMKLMPERLKPNPEVAVQGVIYGVCCMSLMLLTGVAGPMLDSFFLGGKLDRRQIVATKGACQVFGHALKLVYFGSLIDNAAALEPAFAGLAIASAMVGTMLAKQFLERMNDTQYRAWANGLVVLIGSYYLAYGSYLIMRTGV